MMGYGCGIIGFGMLIPLILIGLIIYAIVRLGGNNRNYGDYRSERNDALEILNERYAKGEISDEEYKKKKEVLKH